MSFTVGFDLDMTLIDPREGIVDLFAELSRETGIDLDGPGFASRLGPPLTQEFARYHLDEPTVARLIDRYRELYPDVVVPRTHLLPGAREALTAVDAHGGQAIVVTAKLGRNAQAHLDALGLSVAAVTGDSWAAGKAVALREWHAEVFVGDHLGDITAARAADALSVAVATGPNSAEDLEAAGADVVLDGLQSFPAWLDSYLRATVH